MNIQELLQGVETKKISIIMQVNLEKDSTIKSDAIGKYIRAIESFRSQLYKNCELIIVSDGCRKSHQLYSRSYKNESNIKFAYYDRSDNEPAMKSEVDEYTYYRGFARRVGNGMATGDLITYMDADDILTPYFSITLMLIYNQYSDKDWWINTAWYDSSDFDSSEDELMSNDIEEIVQIDGIPGDWKKSSMKDGYISNLPWLLMHRAGISTKWRDVKGNITEYTDFNKRLREQYPNGVAFNNPIYVRGYLEGKWDF